MGKPDDMKFVHSYKNKMGTQNEGVFQKSDFKSYIGDGAEALNDKIVSRDANGRLLDRSQVMQKIRSELRQQMQDANKGSGEAARSMSDAHAALRREMRDALAKARNANEKKKKFEQRAASEKRKEEAKNRETENFSEGPEKVVKKVKTVKKGKKEEFNAKLENNLKKNLKKNPVVQQPAEINQIRNDDLPPENTWKITRFLRCVGIMKTKTESQRYEEAAGQEKRIVDEQMAIVHNKAKSWNEKRKRDHEEKTFRQYYDEFDQAAGAYHMLSRYETGADKILPAKSVKEYVGEFDINVLDNKLTQLDTLRNADEERMMDVIDETMADKKRRMAGRNDYLKSHEKITLLSEKDENGIQRRYKLNSKFEGYLATRQLYSEKNGKLKPSTALINNNRVRLRPGVKAAGPKLSAAQMKLLVDEKDAAGHFLYDEKNVEIQQVKNKLIRGKQVDGVMIHGRFITSDRRIVTGRKDYYATEFLRVKTMKQKEEVRKAVLKGTIFQQINSRTIQHYAGYGAGGQADVAKKSIIATLAKRIQSKDGYKYWKGPKAVVKDPKNKNDVLDALDEQKKEVAKVLFSKEYDDALLKKDRNGKKIKTTVLPNDLAKQWEKLLFSKKPEEKKDLPSEFSAKVVYDIIRQEYHNDAKNKSKLLDKDTRIGKAVHAISGDPKALIDVSLLLLSNDNMPEYWDMAKQICTEVNLTNFEKNFKGTFDGRYQRALNHAGTEKGQLMRIALIDELTTDRGKLSNFIKGDGLAAFMPTRFKQFKEDVNNKRGIGAMMGQKLLDGTTTTLVEGIFDSFLDIADYFEFGDNGTLGFEAGTLGALRHIQSYTSLVNSAFDLGFIPSLSGYLTNDMVVNPDSDATYENAEGKKIYSQAQGRNVIANAVKVIPLTIKLIKEITKYQKAADKESEKKRKKDPNFDYEAHVAALTSKTHGLIVGLLNVGLGLSESVVKMGTTKAWKTAKNAVASVKGFVGAYQGYLDYVDAKRHKISIQKTSKELKTAVKQENLNDDNRDLAGVLKDNSQLQYGLSLAKRNAKEKQVDAVFDIVSNVGKFLISGIKAIAPKEALPWWHKALDATWAFIVGTGRAIKDVVMFKKSVNKNLNKMIGKDLTSNVSKSVITKVLQREAGITSTDYLPDLAKIFMAIDTDVFLKEAGEDRVDQNGQNISENTRNAEKKLGAKIANTLFNNTNYKADDPSTLKKADYRGLMGVMGVKGNFRGIMKNALHPGKKVA